MKKKIKKSKKKVLKQPIDLEDVGLSFGYETDKINNEFRNPYYGMNPFLIESICDNED